MVSVMRIDVTVTDNEDEIALEFTGEANIEDDDRELLEFRLALFKRRFNEFMQKELDVDVEYHT